ncbi:MAG TPA: type II toxin-antitoxin system VapB family antitoxin [Thermoanaerobaculia bacterium]|nr:type II toxin-antitoxin system VapB family antitoxin [Thermoanaerobaculia bacterium]
MPTNLAIDDVLLESAKRLGGHRTKRETVNQALAEYIARRKRLAALESLGTIDFDEAFDHKKARTKR